MRKTKLTVYCRRVSIFLWHRGGKLRVLNEHRTETVIDDPWKGWIDLLPEESPYPHVSSSFSGVVYFGVNITDFEIVEGEKEESIGLSAFE